MLISYFALLAVLATSCLAEDTRVINGEPAEPHQFPYHVGLYWLEKGMPVSLATYYSGGALIGDTWILTAAYNVHIISDSIQIAVKAGKHIVDQKETNEQVRFAIRHIIHPKYEPPSSSVGLIGQNDIALLKVNIPFDLNDYVRAITLPSAGTYFEFGSLAGWGSISMESYVPNIPKELHYNSRLPVINSATCADAINFILADTTFLSVKINSEQVCSGPVNGNSGACFLDRGSAFVKKADDNTYVIIGVVSWNHWLCGTSNGAPTVYTRVSAYSDWINDVMDSS